MKIQEKIALRIRELRKKKGLSQEALAYDADVDRTYMSHVENGRKNISVETLERIIKALDIDFPEFFSMIKK